ncbi:MAG: cysteine hydrolase family protein [Acidimicrobiales bacterium]
MDKRGGARSEAKLALLVVDMQNDFLSRGSPLLVPSGQAALSQAARAVAAARANDVMVIYTRSSFRSDGLDLGLSGTHYGEIGQGSRLVEGSLGAEIHADIAPLQGDVVITKHRYSAFYGSDLDIVLQGAGVSSVAIAGVTTENCCHATARDAMFRGYEVIVLSDATAAYPYRDRSHLWLDADEVQEVTLAVLAGSTASVITAKEFTELARLRAPARVDDRDHELPAARAPAGQRPCIEVR